MHRFLAALVLTVLFNHVSAQTREAYSLLIKSFTTEGSQSELTASIVSVGPEFAIWWTGPNGELRMDAFTDSAQYLVFNAGRLRIHGPELAEKLMDMPPASYVPANALRSLREHIAQDSSVVMTQPSGELIFKDSDAIHSFFFSDSDLTRHEFRSPRDRRLLMSLEYIPTNPEECPEHIDSLWLAGKFPGIFAPQLPAAYTRKVFDPSEHYRFPPQLQEPAILVHIDLSAPEQASRIMAEVRARVQKESTQAPHVFWLFETKRLDEVLEFLGDSKSDTPGETSLFSAHAFLRALSLPPNTFRLIPGPPTTL